MLLEGHMHLQIGCRGQKNSHWASFPPATALLSDSSNHGPQIPKNNTPEEHYTVALFVCDFSKRSYITVMTL
jgi:hypothetical protein